MEGLVEAGNIGRVNRVRGERRPGRLARGETVVAPIQMDDSDEHLAKEDAEVERLKGHLGELEEELAAVKAKLGAATAENAEYKETLEMHDDLFDHYGKTKDVEEFANLCSTWKGKAKAFDAQVEPAKKMMEENSALKAQLASERQKVVDAEARASKSGAAVASAGSSASSADKARYEQALRDLEAARSKVAGLEKQLKQRDAECADLRSRLSVATAAAASSGSAAGVAAGGEDDPLVEMVERLLKDMEQMAQESEEYLAQVEKEFPSLTAASPKAPSEHTDSDDEPIRPVKVVPPAAAQPAAKPAAKPAVPSATAPTPPAAKPAYQGQPLAKPTGQAPSASQPSAGLSSAKPAASAAIAQQTAKAPAVPVAPASQEQQKPTPSSTASWKR